MNPSPRPRNHPRTNPEPMCHAGGFFLPSTDQPPKRVRVGNLLAGPGLGASRKVVVGE